MKKLFLLTFLVLLCLPTIGFSQVYDFNAYKYIVISEQGDQLDIGSTVSQEFKSYGVESLINGSVMPADFINCEALYCQLIYSPYETLSQTVQLKLTDCDGNLIAESKASCAVCGVTVAAELKKASKKAVRKLKKLKEYKYDATILEHKPPNVELTNETESSFEMGDKIKYTQIKSRNDLLKYYDKNPNDIDEIVGIYEKYKGDQSTNDYVLGVIKINKDKNNYEDFYEMIQLGKPYGNRDVGKGGVKITVKPIGSSNNTFNFRWRMANAKNIEKGFAIKEGAILSFQYTRFPDAITKFIKTSSPEIINKKIPNKIKGEWAGNGSGLIISKSGYIVTNNHVIDDVDEIEVEFILNGELQKFNAEIVQVDKVNDLAIIKIFDMNFDGLDDLPYNFNSRSSDVGTKVYAYGYPMALSVMGKEIKVTDGIISAKSGFDGDITTYQITAAIQKGSSGGPLFDDKGNFIGINSAGIRKDIADNVAYSIKSNYVLNLIDVLPKSIDLPSNTKLKSLSLIDQIKEISKYVVLIKIK